MRRKIRRADCHPELPHYCKGMCQACYQRTMHKRRPAYLARYAKRGRHFGDPPRCHPDRAGYIENPEWFQKALAYLSQHKREGAA